MKFKFWHDEQQYFWKNNPLKNLFYKLYVQTFIGELAAFESKARLQSPSIIIYIIIYIIKANTVLGGSKARSLKLLFFLALRIENFIISRLVLEG